MIRMQWVSRKREMSFVVLVLEEVCIGRVRNRALHTFGDCTFPRDRISSLAWSSRKFEIIMSHSFLFSQRISQCSGRRWLQRMFDPSKSSDINLLRIFPHNSFESVLQFSHASTHVDRVTPSFSFSPFSFPRSKGHSRVISPCFSTRGLVLSANNKNKSNRYAWEGRSTLRQ